ncbi:SipW-dependent-type signal peptide-containing protein [Enterococcus bulliens]
MNAEKRLGASRKKYSLLLVALLLIGVATYGTYAYFTDSKSVDSGLTLKNGTVTLGEFSDNDWSYKGNTKGGSYTQELKYKNPNIQTNEGASFENVLPGDTFTKTIAIPYTGTAQADVTFKTKVEKLNGLEYTFEVNDQTINEQNTLVVNSGDTLTFDLTVSVPYGDQNDKRDQKSDFLANISKLITVTATQHLENK